MSHRSDRSIRRSVRIVLAVAALAAVASVTPVAPASLHAQQKGADKAAAKVDAALEPAMKAFQEGEWTKAIDAAGQIEPSSPLFAKALYLMGEAEYARGDASAAEKSFRRILETKKDSVPALTGLGRCLTTLGKHEDAEKSLRRAVQLDAKDVGAARSLGEALSAAGKHDDARKVLDGARKLDAKDPLVARAVVEACLRAGDADAAGAAAAAFAKTAPDSSMAWFLKGIVLDKQGETKDAIDAYEKSIEKDERFLDAHKNLAILCIAQSATYSNAERVKKSFAHFDRYFELGGRDPELKQVYATIRAFFGAAEKGAK